MHSQLYLLFLLSSLTITFAFEAGIVMVNKLPHAEQFKHGNIQAAIKWGNSSVFADFDPRTLKIISVGNLQRDYSQIRTHDTKIPDAAAVFAASMLVKGDAGEIEDVPGCNPKVYETNDKTLGRYVHLEHIDNPHGFGAEGPDPRMVHPDFRGPVVDGELDIDPKTGMKNYIANESGAWNTTIKYTRELIIESAKNGREYVRTGNITLKDIAALQTGRFLHTLEDFFAHSNYVELALLEHGVKGIWPLVGNETYFTRSWTGRKIYPITTGSFSDTDFMSSLVGGLKNRFIESGACVEKLINKNGKTDSIISFNGLTSRISAITQPYITVLIKFLNKHGHDLAHQDAKQSKIFDSPKDSNPTHTQASKDHLDHYLNTPAGLVSIICVRHALEKVVSAWHDPSVDLNEVAEFITSTFHHPYYRDNKNVIQRAVFAGVVKWWYDRAPTEREACLQGLSAEGVSQGRNHRDMKAK